VIESSPVTVNQFQWSLWA